jgi:hypothetical protein
MTYGGPASSVSIGTGMRRPLPRCPRCHGLSLRAVSDTDQVNFLCLECFRCWHVELGWVHRVVPSNCPGCPARDRCARIYTIDHPDPVRTR